MNSLSYQRDGRSWRMANQTALYHDRLEFHETNTKPKAGAYYTVPKGAWLDSISISAYGQDKTDDIIKANPFLSGRSIHAGSRLPYIYPGDKLWLPPKMDAIKEPDTIPASNPDEIGIRIEGQIYKGWQTARATRSLFTCADSFVFEADYDPNNEESKILDPKTYYLADLFIGGEKYISGEMLKWFPDSGNGKMKVEVRSLPGVTIECQSLEKQLDYNNMTLQQIADSILGPFGIATGFPDGDTDAFIKVNRDIQATVFDFLKKLAQQKGFVITSSADNEMVFCRANLSGAPVAALIAGEYPLIDVQASYDGTARFSHYVAVSQSAGNQSNKAEEKDSSIPIYRPHIFTADDTEAGNISDAAKWKKSRALAASSPTTAIVKGWRDPQDALWMENTKVSVYFPRACIFHETEFLITQVNLTKDENGGDIAELPLTLPQAFTPDFPGGFQWER